MPTDLLFTVSANFTAEPIRAVLQFWIETLGFGPARVEFSGYNQVFQELMSPDSPLVSNRPGVNFILIRLEDWGRDQATAARAATVGAAGREFLNAFPVFALRTRRPSIVLLCPPSRNIEADGELARLIHSVAATIREGLAGCRGVTVLDGEDTAALYPVVIIDDPDSDRNGHVPFTQAYWVAMGTMLARHARVLIQPPQKLIAVDADNTLWGGVAAEVGAGQVQVDGAWATVQKFLLGRKRQGVLLVLTSKNREEDVAEVFSRPDMVLRRDDFVAWKVNWKPKSENLRELAAELGLGLDSFVFLDDNPVECAEVEAHCPAVTVLGMPAPDAALRFLRHVWAFDLPPATAADVDRTEQYRQQAERALLMAGTISFRDFLEKLELRVEFAAVAPDQIDRAAQLTQRTNQFNATGLRRTAAELGSLLRSGEHDALMARVCDRFGDYGDVGLCIYSMAGGNLEVENFLLSCRVLGKGVEHRLLAELGRMAVEHGKAQVVIPFRRTERNEPAAKFLDLVAGEFRRDDLYCIPAALATAVAFEADEPAAYELASEAAASIPEETPDLRVRTTYAHIARELANVRDILTAIRHRSFRPRPALGNEFVAPRLPVEETLAEIWSEVLGVERVGVLDNFFDLGGDSISSIQIVSRVNEAGLGLTLRQHFQFPVIGNQASFLTTATAAEPVSPSAPFSLARLGQKGLNDAMAILAKTQG